MTKKVENYRIGLDIGNASVGWSVVDDDYNILKFKGKNMWGVRLFEEGKSAADRRVSRGARRRLQRRKMRVSLLKELIAPMVLESDPNFFMRLEKGYATKDDKGYDYNLFISEGFNDSDYYKKFKTIFHLRKHLCNCKEKADPRLIYLALHHIIKYRGNFLYEGQKFEVSNQTQVIDNLLEAMELIINKNELEISIEDINVNEFINIYLQKNVKKGDKKDQLINIFTKINKDSKKIASELVNLLLGYESNLTNLFSYTNIQKEDKAFKTNFSSTKYDEDIILIESLLNDDFEVMGLLHNVYSYMILQEILGGKQMICDAMVEKYSKHETDLKQLKRFIKKYYSLEEYNTIFRKKGIIGNYYGYVNDTKSTSKVELYKFIKNILDKNEEAKDTSIYKEIIKKIEMDDYLPKQNSKDNGAIPYQIHEAELIHIIDNQGEYYPVLKEAKDKIISLFHFRVPYYVGPLNKKSEFSWFERKTDTKITPWNFDDCVDLIQSAENFIRRMTNNCTYLLDQPVIPKKSLLYSKYELLNELNKIRVNGKLLEKDAKQDVVHGLFMQKKKVKSQDLEKFLITKQYYNSGQELDITGFQKEKEFASSLEPWIDFTKIYGDLFTKSHEEIEKIIEWLTVYEDKKILKTRIEKEYPNIDTTKLNQILKKRYSGWSRLSKKLLVDLKVKNEFGNDVSIVDTLEDTNLNFMQIIHDKKLGYNKLIEENMKTTDHGKIDYEQIKELQGSPAIKKGIWQTVKVVEEIKKIMGSQPKHIYIEFARSDDEKKRTQSKVKRLQEIYNINKNELDHDAKEAYKYLSKLDKNAKLDDERLYLYLIQQGKCMYTGKSLDISLLSTYQIDHIVPQSYIKDNSIENKVLVYSNENQYKGDNLLLNQGTIVKQHSWWKYLLDCNLIGRKKYVNLTRNNLSEMEEIGFINRQLVETRQITKHVANIFKNIYEDTKIITIKAALSHTFRQKFDLFKIREINDYHHAQDAYLACVLGTFVLNKYPSLQNEFIFTEYNQIKNYRKDLNLNKTSRNSYGFLINQMDSKQVFNDVTGELVWDGEDTKHKIFKVFNYKDCFITKKLEEKKGQLFNLTLQKVDSIRDTAIKNSPHKVIPVNQQRSEINKYGGFTGIQYAYGIAVEYVNKNKVQRVILDVPIFLADASHEKLLEYLKAETGSHDIKIVKDKILYNQLFEVNGGLYTLASATEWHNAKQLLLSRKSQKTLFYMFNNRRSEVSEEDIVEVYDEYLEKIKNYFPYLKSVYTKLLDMRENFISIESKDKIIKELLKVTQANAANGVLNENNFKISSRTGRIQSKTLYLDDTNFINNSITGMYSQVYKL